MECLLGLSAVGEDDLGVAHSRPAEGLVERLRQRSRERRDLGRAGRDAAPQGVLDLSSPEGRFPASRQPGLESRPVEARRALDAGPEPRPRAARSLGARSSIASSRRLSQALRVRPAAARAAGA